ncbi:MAG: GNAT family N-acetyltransferase [Bacteroidota bacterium]|nr:GNAT family N-acetyltransferase [Bacteroidota bacterium]
MNNLKFVPISVSEQTPVAELIKKLYQQDMDNSKITMVDEKIRKTFKRAIQDPEHLKIEVFKIKNKIIGYAIVFTFWSNEYGGLIFNIDELYIIPEFRNKGIATIYIRKLKKKTAGKAGLSLEVMPGNKKALKLYNRLEFNDTGRRHLIKLLK